MAARGVAHIGVLKVLEELRVPIDAIAATSMGAVVGGAYAAGVSPGQMEAIVTTLDWKDLFTDAPAREFYSIAASRMSARSCLYRSA
ncbi:MAG: patatin-like phospholipase family protein [Gammaproteobacteria bacterium]